MLILAFPLRPFVPLDTWLLAKVVLVGMTVGGEGARNQRMCFFGNRKETNPERKEWPRKGRG